MRARAVRCAFVALSLSAWAMACGDDDAGGTDTLAGTSAGEPGDRDGGSADDGSDGATDTDTGNPDVANSGSGDGDEVVAGDPSRLVGTFTVELVEADPSTGTPALSSLRGFVRDAPVNPQTLWERVREVGDCALETPSFPFCDPDCGPGRDCSGADVCVDEPLAVDVGEVTVSGLRTNMGMGELALTRIGPSYQPQGAVDLEYPPAAEGAELRVQADGGDFAPFEIVSHGIAPLELDVEDALMAAREMPLTASWTPPQTDASTMSAVVDLSHHGGSKGRIVCRLDDAAGELEIDAGLVTELIDLGTAGFPTLRLVRRALGSHVMELGRVDFSVEQSIEIPLEVPGLVSCTESSECPDGQSCLPTRKCG